MRLFVAVPVPGELKEKAASLSKELEQDAIKPVKAENMHATLRFIGEVEGKEKIEEKLRSVQFSEFKCTLKGAGVFPNENYVRVVWAGIESGGKLEELAKQVQDALKGSPGDNRFSAHLTIARVRKKISLKEFLGKHRDEELGTFTVSQFELIESVLGPEGPSYRTVAVFKASG